MDPTTQVSVLSIAMMAVSAVLALFAPLAIFFILRRRRRMRFLPLLVGAVSFVLFALVLEQLVHGAVFSSAGISAFLKEHWWAYTLYGGLMAGIFEETGRLCSFYFVLRRSPGQLGSALSYGVGHGWIEAVVVGAVPMASSIWMAVTLNAGGTLPSVPAAMVGEAVSALTGSSPTLFLATGVERVVAVAAHIALSVLVWMAASGRGPWGLFFLSILLHVVINVPAGLYQSGMLTSIWLIEGLTAVLVVAVCVATAAIYEKCSQSYTTLLNYNPVDFGL